MSTQSLPARVHAEPVQPSTAPAWSHFLVGWLPSHPLTSLGRSLQANLLWLLVGSYVIAACWPGPGQWIRAAVFTEVSIFGEKMPLTLPLLMLAFLLFNAGVVIRPGQIGELIQRPTPLMAGLAANVLVPVAFVGGMTGVMRLWHAPEMDEVQDLLAGLALVASVPVAGSSTAWSQNADGDMPLSVGLVLLSTVLSPVMGPISLACLRPLATGGYATALGELAAPSGMVLLLVCLLVPLALGAGCHRVLGAKRMARGKNSLKLANVVALVLLNYANAAVSLPRLVADPDWHFLGAVIFFATGLCVTLFLSGWLLGLLLNSNLAQRVSLMFGLGMTNNGTGLVLASLALPQYPRVVLPILLYNLIQHLIAGLAERFVRPRASRQ